MKIRLTSVEREWVARRERIKIYSGTGTASGGVPVLG